MDMRLLISALIGALISAALSYWVQSALAKKAQFRSEKRMAYVHFVNISALLAFDKIVRSHVELFTSKIGESLDSEEGKNQPSHKISVLMVDFLLTLSIEKLKEWPEASSDPRLLHSIIDSIKESQLKPEQLALLPKDTILDYSFFMGNLGQLGQALSLWVDFFEHDNRSWLTPETVHKHWFTLFWLIKQAEALYGVFIKHGVVSKTEADALLKKQVEKYFAGFLLKWKIDFYD